MVAGTNVAGNGNAVAICVTPHRVTDATDVAFARKVVPVDDDANAMLYLPAVNRSGVPNVTDWTLLVPACAVVPVLVSRTLFSE